MDTVSFGANLQKTESKQKAWKIANTRNILLTLLFTFSAMYFRFAKIPPSAAHADFAFDQDNPVVLIS